MDTYSNASGQMMNLNKSSVIYSPNVDNSLKVVLEGILGIRNSGLPGKYLGLPEVVERNKKEILGYIKQRIIGRIQGWGHKFLSKAGREVLLKSVLQSIPTYTMGVFMLTDNLLKEVEVVLNSFWWKGKWGNEGGIRWRAWKDLCVPKKWGGMGFRRLKEFNIALLCKQAWNIITNP